MIADDYYDLSFLLKTQLSAGYTVDICNNGDSIIEKLILLKPNLVLLDINMIGVDGEKIMQRDQKRQKTFGYKGFNYVRQL